MKLITTIANKLRQATLCSWAGLSIACQQLPFRLEIATFLIACPVALYLGKTGFEKGVLISSLVLVLMVEIINSAIEVVVDRIGLEHNELSRRAKDLGSAAVLVAILNAVVIWGFIVFY